MPSDTATLQHIEKVHAKKRAYLAKHRPNLLDSYKLEDWWIYKRALRDQAAGLPLDQYARLAGNPT